MATGSAMPVPLRRVSVASRDYPLENGVTEDTDDEKSIDPNVKAVVLGDILIDAWYPSFYPEELIGKLAERLFVCKWCFKYSKELIPYLNHLKSCQFEHDGPPGKEMYVKDNISMHEIDGEEQKLYTQNLSLFAKLFLDTKSVFYDVTTFLYYVLVSKDSKTGARQVIGFFSKEKMSWDNNNLACILVFPPWQRQGFGQVLMGVSYELSKRDGRVGGPERPLSAPGKRGYRAYWFGEIARFLVSQPAKSKVTVQAISEITFMLPEDIIYTLREMDLLERKKKGGASIVIDHARVLTWAEENRVSFEPPIDVHGFVERVADGEGNDAEMAEEVVVKE